MTEDDVEQEDTDLHAIVRLEILCSAASGHRDKTHGLRCFIICKTLCTFALTEWLELADLRGEKETSVSSYN